jgi:hypothetical protein
MAVRKDGIRGLALPGNGIAQAAKSASCVSEGLRPRSGHPPRKRCRRPWPPERDMTRGRRRGSSDPGARPECGWLRHPSRRGHSRQPATSGAGPVQATQATLLVGSGEVSGPPTEGLGGRGAPRTERPHTMRNHSTTERTQRVIAETGPSSRHLARRRKGPDLEQRASKDQEIYPGHGHRTAAHRPGPARRRRGTCPRSQDQQAA